VDRNVMIAVVETVTERQDVGDVDGIVELFAPDCTFMMPVLGEAIRGHGPLREHVTTWPKAATTNEWIAVDGNRLVCGWSWRGEGWPDDTPLLRGVSTYLFNEDGLIQDYEDFFDPDWVTRHGPGT
jgi:SnoaL-like domain